MHLAKTGVAELPLRRLIEGLMKHDVTALIFDPHGEYGAMRDKGPYRRATGISM
jgi:DNA helicase HerA-like ATPase